MKWFITGEPGVGKTTLILRLYEKLKENGIECDGFISKDIREGNFRVGFIILDLKTKETAILASKRPDFEGPRMGSYTINIKGIDEVAVKALERAFKSNCLIICDEIGTMELFSENFKRFIEEILRSKNDLLATLHRKHTYYVEMVKTDEKELLFLTRNNWNSIFETLYQKIFSRLKKTK